MKTDHINLQQALDFEIRSSVIVPWIFWDWGQQFMARYYARKVQRQYARYKKSYQVQQQIFNKLKNL